MSGFSGFVWTEGAFVLKKSIQTQKCRDSYGRRLSQTQFLSWNRNYPKLGFSNNQWRIQGGPGRGGGPPPPLIFDQTEAPRAEFFFFLEAGPLPPPLSQGQEDRASPLSEGLCGFTEHFTTYAYCYSFLHFLFITVLSSCSSRCVPACVCCLYWWDCKKLPSPTKQLQTLAPTAGAFSQRGNTYIVCSSKNVWNRPPELPCRLLSLFRPIVNAMNFNDSDSGECHTNFIGGER